MRMLVPVLLLASLLLAAPAQAGDPRDLVEARPLPVECVNGLGQSWCSVDAVVCQYKQTTYHLEDDRTVTELRCLGVVECTWDSGASSARAETEPFCPVP